MGLFSNAPLPLPSWKICYNVFFFFTHTHTHSDTWWSICVFVFVIRTGFHVALAVAVVVVVVAVYLVVRFADSPLSILQILQTSSCSTTSYGIQSRTESSQDHATNTNTIQRDKLQVLHNMPWIILINSQNYFLSYDSIAGQSVLKHFLKQIILRSIFIWSSILSH